MLFAVTVGRKCWNSFCCVELLWGGQSSRNILSMVPSRMLKYIPTNESRNFQYYLWLYQYGIITVESNENGAMTLPQLKVSE